MKRKLIVKISLYFILSIVFISCTDKNEGFFPAEIVSDNISGRTIKYTLQLSAAANPTDTIYSLYGAKVFLAMNDTVFVKEADSVAMLSFGNLADGNIVVRIEHPNFYTYNYIVNLKAQDSIDFSSTNFRNASSIIQLVPKIDVLSASVQGHFYADLDLSQAGFENIGAGVGVGAYLSDSTQISLAEVSQGSSILDAWLELPSFYTQSNASGEFRIELPVASRGLNYIFTCDNLYSNQVDALGNNVNTLFYTTVKEQHVFPYSDIWLDFYYTF